MSIKRDLAFMLTGVGATILYQQIKNGNVEKFIEKKMRAEKKLIDDLEDMM